MQAIKGGLRFAETKTSGSRRLVLLPARTVEALRQHRAAQSAERLRIGPAWEDNDLVFANEVGRPIAAGNLLKRSFEPLLRRADLPRIRFHDLRHTSGTLSSKRASTRRSSRRYLATRGSARRWISTRMSRRRMQQQAADAFDVILAARQPRSFSAVGIGCCRRCCQGRVKKTEIGARERRF
jgi:integrase